MKSVNEAILNGIVRYDIDLHRFTVNEATDIASALIDLKHTINRLIHEYDVSSVKRDTLRMKRLRALLKQIESTTDKYYDKMAVSHYDILRQESFNESMRFPTYLNDTVDAQLFTVGLPASVWKRIASPQMVIQGGFLSEWWKHQNETTQRIITHELRIGLGLGETANQLTTRMNQLLTFSRRYQAEALARTALQQVYQDVRSELYEANKDVIRAVQWVATLDTRTTPICRALDGQTWRFPSMKPLTAKRKFPGYPPIHWNCRSTVTPITRSLRELSKNKKLAKKLKTIKNSDLRSSLNGYVPEAMSYNSWLKTQPVSVQRQILGPARWKMWSEGKVDLNGFINRRGRPYTIEELNDRLGLHLKKVPPRHKKKEKLSDTALIKKLFKEGEDLVTETQNGYEKAVALDKYGKPLFKVSGQRDSVRFSLQERSLMISDAEGMVHNHPSSSAFSVTDLYFSNAHDIVHSAVVGDKVYYYADVSKANLPIVKSDGDILFDRLVQKEGKKLIKQQWAEDTPGLWMESTHRAMKQLSRNWNFKYYRKLLDGETTLKGEKLLADATVKAMEKPDEFTIFNLGDEALVTKHIGSGLFKFQTNDMDLAVEKGFHRLIVMNNDHRMLLDWNTPLSERDYDFVKQEYKRLVKQYKAQDSLFPEHDALKYLARKKGWNLRDDERVYKKTTRKMRNNNWIRSVNY